MACPIARAIVATALDLRRTHPDAPAIDVLDLVMRAHRGSSPEFDAGRSDLTDPGTPFGQLLQAAFDPAYDAAALEAAGVDADARWWHAVMEPFIERYELGAAT
jgi:hypothetical protein